MPMIRNILFDLGGVLLHIDFQRTFEAFGELIPKDLYDKTPAMRRHHKPVYYIHSVFDSFEAKKSLQLFEVGGIPEAEFRSRLQEIAGIKVSDEQFDAAWNALLLDYPEDRIRMVQSLSKDFRVFLLSNTNSIHCRYYNQMLKVDHGIESLGHLMEHAYYSFEMGLRKPDPLIYFKVMKQSNLKPEETLFLDDCEENLEAAKRLGIKTELVSENRTVVDVFGVERIFHS